MAPAEAAGSLRKTTRAGPSHRPAPFRPPHAPSFHRQSPGASLPAASIALRPSHLQRSKEISPSPNTSFISRPSSRKQIPQLQNASVEQENFRKENLRKKSNVPSSPGSRHYSCPPCSRKNRATSSCLKNTAA